MAQRYFNVLKWVPAALRRLPPWRSLASGALSLALGHGVLCPGAVWAGPSDVFVLPTAVVEGGGASGSSEHRQELEGAAHRLDLVLGEAVQDLGLALDTGRARPPSGAKRSLPQLLSQASDRWVISPTLEGQGRQFSVRLEAVAPGSKVLMQRVERVSADDLELQAMHMVRELIGSVRPAAVEPKPLTPTSGEPALRTHSPGRAVLALNSAVIGAFAGYAVQRASGSNDARLVYPLAALGAGMGLGGSMLAADEWEVGVGDAWFLAAGSVWGGASGVLFSEGYDAKPTDARAIHGLFGSMVGLTLGTVSIAIQDASEGGAALTHSGGAYGLLFGALAQGIVEGHPTGIPSKGMAWGAAGGTLAAGALASWVDLSPSRMLLVDLVAGLGSLTGAAAASPLVFGEQVTAAQNRVWYSSVALGTALGAGVGLWVTRPRKPHPETSPAEVPSKESPLANPTVTSSFRMSPYAGPMGERPGPEFSVPLGLGVRGVF